VEGGGGWFFGGSLLHHLLARIFLVATKSGWCFAFVTAGHLPLG